MATWQHHREGEEQENLLPLVTVATMREGPAIPAIGEVDAAALGVPGDVVRNPLAAASAAILGGDDPFAPFVIHVPPASAIDT